MRLPGHKVMIRADSEKVRELQGAVISGGGSGHELAHAGYTGAGMLSASVLGAVFTSKEGPRAWRSGPKQSKRGALLPANWVVPNQEIGRCWMLSIHL